MRAVGIKTNLVVRVRFPKIGGNVRMRPWPPRRRIDFVLSQYFKDENEDAGRCRVHSTFLKANGKGVIGDSSRRHLQIGRDLAGITNSGGIGLIAHR